MNKQGFIAFGAMVALGVVIPACQHPTPTQQASFQLADMTTGADGLTLTVGDDPPEMRLGEAYLHLLAASPGPSPTPTPVKTPTPRPTAVIPTPPNTGLQNGIDLGAIDQDIFTMENNAIAVINRAHDQVVKVLPSNNSSDLQTFSDGTTAVVNTYVAAVQIVRQNVAGMDTSTYANVVQVMVKARRDLYNARLTAVGSFNASVMTYDQAWKTSHQK